MFRFSIGFSCIFLVRMSFQVKHIVCRLILPVNTVNNYDYISTVKNTVIQVIHTFFKDR